MPSSPRLVVLGANGRVGRQVVRIACQRGLGLTAVVRSRRWAAPSGVRRVLGDVTEPAVLAAALEGPVAAVVSTVGHRISNYAPWGRLADPGFLDRLGPVLAEALAEAGQPRLVAVSAAGVGDSWERVSIAFRAAIAGSALRHAYRSLARFEDRLAGGGGEVVLPRPSLLTDERATGRARTAHRLRGPAPRIPRADVAAWLVETAIARSLPVDRRPLLTVTGAG